WRYGRWVHFPWSGRLVHVLPEAEYRELRTSRNRNKITDEEQERLRGLRIGIVGLSIGQAAAVTLTLEEVGGLLVLADFDFLELSNMNRLRVGVHGLGVNKAVLAAREVFEINPYARVELWTKGVDASNVDAFLTSGGRPLDLVYEECDDLGTKVLVRERARHFRIPVLMETSDRGLMDIERFDLEPDRPIFHGLAGELSAASLRGMSNYEKVPVILKIVGREGMSDRMAASMVDIESSLKSWPQLASEVALGAGLNVDTARRIALGQLTCSGRFYVDPHQHIDDATARPVEVPQEPVAGISDEAHHFELPPLNPSRGPVTLEDVRTLVAWAVTAFSGGNCQPWRFEWRDPVLDVLHEPERSESMLDVDHRASYLAFGSVLENLALAAPALGVALRSELFPDATDPRHIARIELSRSLIGTVDPLLRRVADRVTNRRLGPRASLEPALLARLEAAAAVHGAHVAWVTDPAALDTLGALLGRADRVRMLSRRMHGEMMGEVRWSLEEVERTRDGLDVATLEMTPTDLAGMRVIQSWPVMRMVGMVGGGAGLERPTRKAMDAASAAGLLLVRGTGPEDFLRAGRGLHRLWLQTAEEGLAMQPMTSVTYLFHRLVHAGGEGLSSAEKSELGALRQRYLDLFPVPDGHAEPMLFRLGRAEPPTARSLRRTVDEVLVAR
ncbi:MAG: Rv1355c family protein, partial [Myxococcales bacterium]|nr:Rv1355c family protein [Myxococcales bacterium]